MLLLYDKSHVKIAGLTSYRDLKLEQEINTDDTLYFFMPSSDTNTAFMVEECYIQTPENEYVIKEVNNNEEDWVEFVCKINLEVLKGSDIAHFETVTQTCTNAVNLALVGTTWTIGTCDVTKKRTVRKVNCSVYEVLKEIQNIYGCEMTFDSVNKKINIYQKLGTDKGVYFTDQLNLKELTVQRNSYSYITRLIPIGKDDLRISSVNDGLEYVSNHQYSSKIITAYWEDNRYTIAQDLKEDAIDRLAYLSIPYKSYKADIYDLAHISSEYGILDYKLGDTVYLLSKMTNTKEVQRIIKLVRFLDEPEKNTCDISNVLVSLDQLQTRFVETSEIVDSVTTSDGMVDGNKLDSVEYARIKNVSIETTDIQDAAITEAKIGLLAVTSAKIADASIETAKIKDLAVTTGKIQDAAITNAKIDNAAIDSLQVKDAAITNAKIKDLAVTTGKIQDVAITNAKIGNLAVSTGKIQDAAITNAKIGELAVSNAQIQDAAITNAKIDRAGIDKLVVISADIGDAQITTAKIDLGAITTALIDEAAIGTTQIADGSITDAKIVELTANKLTAGKIDAASIEVINLNAANLTVGTINGTQISELSIDRAHLIDGSVGTAQIEDLSITDDKIVQLSADKLIAGIIDAGIIDVINLKAANVTIGEFNETQIANGAITTNKIAADTITGDKLVMESITARELASESVLANHIKAGEILASHIRASEITAVHMATGSITAEDGIIASLNAEVVSTGTLKSIGNESWINLEDGTFSLGGGMISYRQTEESGPFVFSINYSDTNLNDILTAQQDRLQMFDSFLVFDELTGLTIGRQESQYFINIDDDEMQFIYNGSPVASITGEKMTINSLSVANDITIGYHKIEKYQGAPITMFKFIGGV